MLSIDCQRDQLKFFVVAVYMHVFVLIVFECLGVMWRLQEDMVLLLESSDEHIYS